MGIKAGGTDVKAIFQTDFMMDDTVECTVLRASGVAAGGAPATNAMVAAVAGKKLRVLALMLHATAATANNVYVKNGDNNLLFNSGNPLPMAIDADADNVASFILPFNPVGWFDTDTANEALDLVSSAAQDIAYTVTYLQVD